MEVTLVYAVAPFQAHVGRVGLVEHVKARPLVVVARSVRTHTELVVLPDEIILPLWADLRIAERISRSGG